MVSVLSPSSCKLLLIQTSTFPSILLNLLPGECSSTHVQVAIYITSWGLAHWLPNLILLHHHPTCTRGPTIWLSNLTCQTCQVTVFKQTLFVAYDNSLYQFWRWRPTLVTHLPQTVWIIICTRRTTPSLSFWISSIHCISCFTNHYGTKSTSHVYYPCGAA